MNVSNIFLPTGMSIHSTRQSSPVGFQATLNLAMELENKLNSEVEDRFSHLQQPKTNGDGHYISLNNIKNNDDEEEDDEDDDEKRSKLNSMLLKNDEDLRKDVLSNSDPMDNEMMEEDDDDSMGRSSPGSYADLSPSIDNSKEGTEDLDDDFDLSMKRYNSSVSLNRMQQPDGSSQAYGVNGGGRPGSSEGDYYDGGINGDSYGHMGRSESVSPNIENGGSDKFYPCHLCNFSATTKCHFKSHMNTHYNHKCNHCDYTSRTEGRLKRHMKDFHSDLPPESYSSSRILKSDREHGDSNGNSQGKIKTYRCKQCNFTATVKAIFWEHTKSHIKAEKLLTCPKCPFVTEYKHHLEYHLRNHFGSKPFKCPKCNYSCVNKSMLNSHMKSHSNIYQYRCNDCTYATKYCHSLKLHLRKYTHKPAVVLNPDGTPNPVPVIDVYGTRRGPRQKKSQIADDQKMFCNSNGNANGNGPLPYSPIQMPVNGALSPATVIPFFYPGASASMPNGYHPGMDTLLRPGSVEKSPSGIPPPPPPPPPLQNSHINNHHNNNNGGINGSITENDHADNEKIHHHSKSTAIKCNLCSFMTDHREIYSKHMILHAAAENQDLCNLYGINSESLVMEPNQRQQQQQQLNATAMAVMAAALSMSNGARSDIHRQSVTMTSAQNSPEELRQDSDFQNSPNSTGNSVKSKPNSPEGEVININGNLHMTTPLDHLRMFSEQANIQPYNSLKDFVPHHYSSPNYTHETAEKVSTSLFSQEENTQKASQKLRNSKDGAINVRNKSPATNEVMNVTSGLGPLDLSHAKNGPVGQRGSTNNHHMSHLHSPRFLSGTINNQSPPSILADPYENLQVSTDGVSCAQAPDLISPTNQTKNRRKGKAFKLDRICMKLQKDSTYSDSASNELIVDDSASVGDSDTRPRSSEDNISDVEADYKHVEIKVEVDHHSESNSLQSPLKQMDTNSSLTNGKTNGNYLHLRNGNKSLDNLKKLPSHSNRSSAPVVTLIEGDDDENEQIGKSGNWKEAYECQYCDMAFKDCIMYTVHMGYHGFKDPFKCNMCGHQTKDKVAFFLHIARTAHL